MLLVVVYATGGVSSEYYAGLVLMFSGLPVLVPIAAAQGTWIVSVLLFAFAVSPWVLGQSIDWAAYSLHMFFPVASAIVCVASCELLDRMRFKDFMRRREVENARDALKALDREKARFTSNVHHELRTPLTLILAPLEAMLGGDLGSASSLQRGYLKTMRTNGLRLLNLINNLLDLAKIEGNKLEIARRPLDLRRLIESLVDGARPLAERKGVQLDVKDLESVPLINGDQEAIEKVIVNLVGNSLKLTDAGGRIEVLGNEGAEGGVHLIVSDSGIGLAKEQLDRIFDRFAQVDTSNTRQHEGTGIGLALVEEIVGLHNGRIWAESEGVGRGSRFHVSFADRSRRSSP